MKHSKQKWIPLLIAGLCACSTVNIANAEQSEKHVSFARDNTAVNVRDRQANLITPESQATDAQAIQRTKMIREAVVMRKELSSYAQNIKIITNAEGVVALRGPVRNEAERAEIVKIAQDIAGPKNVIDLIEIAPK